MCGVNSKNCGVCQPTNQSNRTVVVPVEGQSAYLTWLAYNPELDPRINPESPWTEKYWLDNFTKGEKGEKGDGVQIKGSVPTYADLTDISPVPEVGDSYIVDADGLMYVYGENGFPPQGQGVQIKGESGDTYIPEQTNNYFDQ